MKESDLYLPLKAYLETQDYEVKGEVRDCDVLAIHRSNLDAEPIIVELKKSLNLTVLLQAVDRLSLSSQVYIGLPKQYKLASNRTRKAKVLKLLKMLGLGLIVIDPSLKTANVDILVEPKHYQPKKSKPKLQRHLKEFHSRAGDPNLGGASTLKGRVTAYRQRSLTIAKFLNENGATKAAIIAEQTQDSKARDILYKNYYGWFANETRGVYKITVLGMKSISEWS
jgi:hypothetical protein